MIVSLNISEERRKEPWENRLRKAGARLVALQETCLEESVIRDMVGIEHGQQII